MALLVAASEDDGGMARSVFLLARDMAACGVRSHVVLHRESRFARRLRDAGIDYDVVPELIETGLRGSAPDDQGLGALIRNLREAPRAIRRIREIARGVGATVLYGHGTWSCYLVAAIGRHADMPPVVWHIRNDHSAVGTRLGGRLAAQLGGVRAIIAVSDAAARPYAGLRPRLHVVRNGADLSAARTAVDTPVPRTRLGLDESATAVGFAGRLTSPKGVDVLMNAFRLAAPRVPALHLVIFGESARHAPLDQVGAQRDRAQAWGLSSRVHLLGYVDQIEAHLAALDMVVVPSVCRDGCPRTVLEAMAVGRPVIASQTGGIPELVRPDVTGLLVPPGATAQLAEAMVTLATDPERRRRLGAGARHVAYEQFDSTHTAAKVASVLREIAHSPQAPVN